MIADKRLDRVVRDLTELARVFDTAARASGKLQDKVDWQRAANRYRDTAAALRKDHFVVEDAGRLAG